MAAPECDHKRPKAAHSSEISAEPVCDDGGYLRKLKSLNSTDLTDKSQFRQSPTRAADKWRFVNEGDDGCNRSNSWNEASGLVGFSVTGGKTELSQNLQKKGLVEHKSNNNESRFVKISKRLELSNSTDDEDMSEWFGDGGNLETPRYSG